MIYPLTNTGEPCENHQNQASCSMLYGAQTEMQLLTMMIAGYCPIHTGCRYDEIWMKPDENRSKSMHLST